MPAPKNRDTREENAAIKAGEEPEGWADESAKRSKKDTDARRTKKHGKSHYGYKNHVNVDRQHKLVPRYHVSDAALHDSLAVDHLLMQANTGAGVWADPAYRSEEIEASLVKRARPQARRRAAVGRGLDRVEREGRCRTLIDGADRIARQFHDMQSDRGATLAGAASISRLNQEVR